MSRLFVTIVVVIGAEVVGRDRTEGAKKAVLFSLI
jgi:hypothetical protein